MHKNKTYIFCFFFKMREVLNFLDFLKFQRKTKYFNDWSVSYNVSLQPNIKWNSLKKNILYFLFEIFEKNQVFLIPGLYLIV